MSRLTRPTPPHLVALAALLATAPALAQQAAPHDQAAAPAPQPAHEPDVVFVPTPERVVAAMLELAKVGKDDVVYDLGCGDGRIVIAAAKRGVKKAVGVDIDPERIQEARANAKAAGVEDRVRFVEGDLFETPIDEATVVTLYLLPALNLRLRPKLLALKPGTRVVSHAFDMGDWKPARQETVEGKDVFLWTVPPHAAPAAMKKGAP